MKEKDRVEAANVPENHKLSNGDIGYVVSINRKTQQAMCYFYSINNTVVLSTEYLKKNM